MTHYTRTTRFIRILLFVASLLVAVAGMQLFLGSETTDRYFAWTVLPPITAAFLGAGFWSSFALEMLAARQPYWAHSRIAVPAALLFATLTLITTLLHLDRFHFGSDRPETLLAVWAWLLVYVLVPPLLVIALVMQTRLPSNDPPRQAPFPGWLRLALMVQGAIMFIFGLALFIAPEAVSPLWPWQLSPLTGRATAAWLISLGVAAFHAGWENDLVRVRPAIVSYLVFGLLQVVVLLRYSSLVQWSEPGAWVYVLFLAAIIATAWVALMAGLRKADIMGRMMMEAKGDS